jgi:hypothetical protein
MGLLRWIAERVDPAHVAAPASQHLHLQPVQGDLREEGALKPRVGGEIVVHQDFVVVTDHRISNYKRVRVLSPPLRLLGLGY